MDIKKIVVVATELQTLEILESQCREHNIVVKFLGAGKIGGEDLAGIKILHKILCNYMFVKL